MGFPCARFSTIAFCLASIVVQGFGELVLSRGPLTGNGTVRKLTCVSEDDDSALIWNFNPGASVADNEHVKNNFTNFQPKKPTSYDVSACAIRDSTLCVAKWGEGTEEWRVVNSAVIPMGPVFDYRWESFREFTFEDVTSEKEYQYVGEVEKSGMIVFSVRALQEAHVLLCENEKPSKGPCFWIIIGGSRGQQSEIRTCSTGAPEIPRSRDIQRCEGVTSTEHGVQEVVHAYEWRTLTINWISKNKTIQVFKETDRKKELLLEGTLRKWHDVSHISVGGEIEARFRFHFYDYFITKDKSTDLRTKEFDEFDGHFCVDMLVGLCPQCTFRISLLDKRGRRIELGDIDGNENLSYNDVPAWQSVRLSNDINPKGQILEIRTIRNPKSGKGRWAISSLHTCRSVGELRKSTITIDRYKISSTLWSLVSCQKLSYTNSAVVNSSFAIASNENAHRNPRSVVMPIIQNLEIDRISESEVRLSWKALPPENGVLPKYNASIKLDKLLGCEELNMSTPAQKEISRTVNTTTVSFSDLHPYAIYTAIVVTDTTISGKPATKDFQTLATKIPTSKVSNLRVGDNKLSLDWNKPTNCTTITGPTTATRLYFEDVSNPGRNWNASSQAKSQFFHLNRVKLPPHTKYRVRAYVIRDFDLPHNPDIYSEITGWTAPALPPAVTKLEIYAADSKAKTISLRWVPPNPANGEIEVFHVHVNDHVIGRVPATVGKRSCAKKRDFVCATFKNLLRPDVIAKMTKIQVSAKNKGVKGFGPKSPPIRVWDSFFKVHSQPQNLIAIQEAHGTVSLTWSHPSVAYVKIVRFLIKVEFLKSNLLMKETIKAQFPMMTEYPVSQYDENYTKKLYLPTSSSYRISVTAMNINNLESSQAMVNISVNDAEAFLSEGTLEVSQNGTLIDLKIPGVINATENTVVTVTVKRFLTCTMKSEKSSLPSDQSKWVADEYKPDKSPKTLTIGTNQNANVSMNCSLHLGETYDIIVNIKDRPSVPKLSAKILMASSITLAVNEKSRLTWWIILPIIAVCLFIVLFIWHLNRKRLLRQPSEPRYVEPNLPLATTILRQPREPSYVEPNPPMTTRISKQSGEPSYLEFIPGPSAATNAIRRPEVRRNKLSAHLYTMPDETDLGCVSTENFEEYAKEAATSGLLYSQFILFRSGMTRPCEYGNLPENMPKNRDRHLIAYDDTRVVLEKISGDPFSDYINANWVQGYKKEMVYIATQGPKPNTVNDFWRMVWQEEVRVICMLTNVVEGKEINCEKYWPDIGTSGEYGDFVVSTIEHQVFADYTFRTFRLSYQQRARKVSHLHYTGWPSHGVPTNFQSLVRYLKSLGKTPSGNGPVVVHCSNGEGRTGTVILCDICLRWAFAEKVINVPAVAKRIRGSRGNMIDTLQQYLLAHIIITESLVSLSTQISCNEILEESDLSDRMQKMQMKLPHDIERLNDSTWQKRTLQSLDTSRPQAQEHVENDELPEPIAESIGVACSDRFQSKSNQINAVSVDGFRVKEGYLACLLPAPFILPDFWRFIAEKNVELIIILQCSDPAVPTCGDILPKESVNVSMPQIQVENKTRLEESDFFTNESIVLNDASQENSKRQQSITVLTCKGWGRGENGKPPPPATLVSLWRASEKILQKEGQTLVLCHDGITGCGLYLALSFLLERMVIERECDVISAVRAVRRSRSEFVKSLEQFSYMYDGAVNYVKHFQTYDDVGIEENAEEKQCSAIL